MATIGDYLGTNLNYSNYDLSQLSDEELQKVLMSYDIYKDSEYVSNLPSINPKTFGYNNPFNINAPKQALPQTSIDAYSSGTGSEITMPDPFNVRSNLPPYKSQNFGERNPFEGSLAIQEELPLTTVYPYQRKNLNKDQPFVGPPEFNRPTDAPKDIPDWMFEPITESTDNQNPIVDQANTPVSNVTTGNVQDSIPVSTGVGRDTGVSSSIGPNNKTLSIGETVSSAFDEMENSPTDIQRALGAVDNTPKISINPTTGQRIISNNDGVINPVTNNTSDTISNVGGMSFEEFTTPPDINIMDPQYDPQFGAGGGGFTDVTANQFTETSAPLEATASTSTGLLDKLGGAENVLGASMMAGGNLLAMNQYGDAISDVQEGLGEIPGMISETLTDAQRETDNIRNYLNTSIESTADASNAIIRIA